MEGENRFLKAGRQAAVDRQIRVMGFSLFCLQLVLFSVSLHAIKSFQASLASLKYTTSSTAKTVKVIEDVIVQSIQRNSTFTIFPEGLLWWYLPTKTAALAEASVHVAVTDSTPLTNPCSDDSNNSDLVTILSCLASKYSHYIVVNVPTKTCDGDSCNLWNAAYAFGTNGQILATYRKSHNYGSQPPYDAPTDFDVSYFTVDNIKFGLLICFDIEFKQPIDELLATGIDYVIMPMEWTNTFPISWSTMYQQSFSYIYDTNLLAVNDGDNAYSWGSGAYASGAVLAQTFSVNESSIDTLLLVNIEKLSRKQRDLATATTSSITDVPAHAQDTYECQFPMYGAGRCAKIVDNTGSLSIKNGNATCNFQWSNAINTNANSLLVAVAHDFSMSTGSTSPSVLHVLICSMVVCVPDGDSTSTCQSSFKSFHVDNAAIALLNDDLSDSYQVLPMAADAMGLGIDTQYMKTLKSDGVYEMQMNFPSESSDNLSTICLKAVDQTTK